MLSCNRVVNHGLLGQNGITAITVAEDFQSRARNLAIRGVGGKIYPSSKFHGWTRDSAPSTSGKWALDRNPRHLKSSGVVARSISGTLQLS